MKKRILLPIIFNFIVSFAAQASDHAANMDSLNLADCWESTWLGQWWESGT